jgi:uncharacterized protein (TIGR02646 family)
MRYIAKNDITLISGNHNLVPLSSFIQTQLTTVPNPLHPAYSGLNSVIKNSLITQMLIEQNGLCCYCMERLETGRHHIEHLASQCGHKNEEVQYYNLYLSCGSGKENKNHCGHAKKNLPIPKLISFYNPQSDEKCEDFFKYNLQGEILPKQGYESMTNNFKEYYKLNSLSKQLVGTIEVLNLNSEILKANRKNIADSIMLLPDNLAQLQTAKNRFQIPDAQGYLDAMFEVAVYFLTFKISRLQ